MKDTQIFHILLWKFKNILVHSSETDSGLLDSGLLESKRKSVTSKVPYPTGTMSFLYLNSVMHYSSDGPAARCCT